MPARNAEKPSRRHQIAAIKSVKYLNFTIDLELVLKLQSSTQRTSHLDAIWAGEHGAGRRVPSVVVIYNGLAMVYYRSWLQKCVALTSAEPEYVALSESTKAVL